MADSPVIVTVLPEYQNEVVVSSEEGSIFSAIFLKVAAMRLIKI